LSGPCSDAFAFCEDVTEMVRAPSGWQSCIALAAAQP
jgi:hypothetical protein